LATYLLTSCNWRKGNRKYKGRGNKTRQQKQHQEMLVREEETKVATKKWLQQSTQARLWGVTVLHCHLQGECMEKDINGECRSVFKTGTEQ